MFDYKKNEMNKIKTAFILMICINLQIVFSQDIDVFERNLNDHFNIPQIAESKESEMASSLKYEMNSLSKPLSLSLFK